MPRKDLYKYHTAKHGEHAVSFGTFVSCLQNGWSERSAIDVPATKAKRVRKPATGDAGAKIERTFADLLAETMSGRVRGE